ncbi:MAG TPA: hypothetical protein VMV69_10300 [Pirellulales bacterium]|nr:hypothetical protein [Pirellulales bacterium]
MTQLSLVEHALCPLDPDASLQPHFVHAAQYFFTDRQGSRRKATARVVCPDGLSAHDEFYLFGLLALTFSQAEPSAEFFATPHYCLRQLGLIDETHQRGGKNYALFRSAIERLSAVTYQNDNFWDPIRAEHCQVSFGFFSYRLPIVGDSSRAWRFYFDPLFFEITKAAGSALAFDLPTYRSLDSASRRLYLLLKKIFWRRQTSVTFDVHHLAVNTLGFSPSHEPWRLRARLAACVETLLDHQLLTLPPEASLKSLFHKQRKGHFSVTFHRGPQFDRLTVPTLSMIDSPHHELLQGLDFDPPTIAHILRTYPQKLVAEWIDITLAARERYGDKFFKRSPQAYLLDNLRHAANDGRTPPDWWHDLRREEERKRPRRDNDTDPDAPLDRYLETEARDAFARVTDRIFADLRAAGTHETEARYKARYIARQNLKAQFYREHPECRPPEPALIPPEHNDADD